MRLSESAHLMERAHSGHFDAWVTRSAAAEAQDLYRMVRFGNCTISSIRELISVPPSIENVLLAYAHSHPEDSGRIARVLRFREEVRKEFDLLVAPKTLFAPDAPVEAAEVAEVDELEEVLEVPEADDAPEFQEMLEEERSAA